MATGLGKTKTFTHLPRHGRVLILSHREELVRQPLREYDCATGVEMAREHASPDAEVVSASVMSMAKRLDRYEPYDFDTIICDECHHAAARTYRDIFDYFVPRKLLGFTATPNRGDKTRLDDVFQEIIFQRDLRWGIENGYLCGIFCKRINIGYDLTAVHTRNGDYAPGELDEAMDGTADAVAQAYREHASGATLIFAVSVHQAEEKNPGGRNGHGENREPGGHHPQIHKPGNPVPGQCDGIHRGNGYAIGRDGNHRPSDPVGKPVRPNGWEGAAAVPREGKAHPDRLRGGDGQDKPLHRAVPSWD